MDRAAFGLALLLISGCDQSHTSATSGEPIVAQVSTACDEGQLATFAAENALRDKPVLIMLHGGPGGSDIPLGRAHHDWLIISDHITLFEVVDFSQVPNAFPADCSNSFEAALLVNEQAVRESKVQGAMSD